MHLAHRRLVAVGLTLVVVAVIGLLYLEALNQGRATRSAWMVTRDLAAGFMLDSGSVRRVRVPAVGDPFTILEESPISRRLAHRVRAQTLLTPEDLLSREVAQVPVSVRSAPSVGVGDTVDVYAVAGGRALLIGRHLVVASSNPLTLLVPAAEEAEWIALEAGSVSLYAARSDGGGPTNAGGVTATEAIAALSGLTSPGPVLTNPPGTPLRSPPPSSR